jgi:hypothetical protein
VTVHTATTGSLFRSCNHELRNLKIQNTMLPPFLYNLVIFSPLLLAAVGFLYALDRLDHNRRAAVAPSPSEQHEYEELDQRERTENHEDYEHAHLNVELEDASDSENQAREVDENAPFLDRPSTPSDSEDEDDFNPDEANSNAPGPANPTPRPRRTPKKLGAKKLKSLERRDRHRAYHEWLRGQSEMRNAELASREEEDREIALENARRRAVEEERIMAKKEKEREERVALEERKVQEEREAVESVVEAVRGRKMVELDMVAKKVTREREWVEAMLRREVLAKKAEEGETRMILGGRWVCLGVQETNKFWQVVEEKGRMDWTEMGKVFEEFLEEPKKGFW